MSVFPMFEILPGNIFFGDCILGMRNIKIFSILHSDYILKIADSCGYHLANQNIFEPKKWRYLQLIKDFSSPKIVVISLKNRIYQRLWHFFDYLNISLSTLLS